MNTGVTHTASLPTDAARVSVLQRNARVSTAIALVCLLFPLGILPGSMGIELVTLGVGLVALLAAAHFSGELKKARQGQ